MPRSQLNRLLIGGLVAALLAGVALSHLTRNTAAQTVADEYGLILDSPRQISDFSLRDQQDQTIGKTELAGNWQVLFFGFTHCPDICPSTLAQLKAVKQQLSENAAQRVRFTMVSVDPERDTPQVLAPYLAHFDPSFMGITGESDAIKKFADELGIAFVKVGEGADYTMDHSTALVVLNPKAEIAAYFSAPHDIEKMAATLNRISGN